jgi:ribose 5-phosphate isomerase B
MKKIAIGCDHVGYLYKEKLKEYLSKEYIVIDVGTFSSESCDYPEYSIKAAELVAAGKCEYGILICKTGEGIMMAANKVGGVRCGVGYNDEVASLMRQHNNANMISFGQAYTTEEELLKRVKIFLNSEFLVGIHDNRVKMILDYESKK